MARFPKQLLMKQLRAKLWRLFYVTHSCKKPKFQADSSWEWEFLWNQYKKNVSVASMAFWFVINVQRQPFFFKQVAQSQLSRVCLDFRNRWKLTISVTCMSSRSDSCMQTRAKNRTPLYRKSDNQTKAMPTACFNRNAILARETTHDVICTKAAVTYFKWLKYFLLQSDQTILSSIKMSVTQHR